MAKFDDVERQRRISKFVADWTSRNDWNEKSHTQSFWAELVYSIFGIDNPSTIIEFEKQTADGGWIDVFFPKSFILVEQKACGKNLSARHSKRGTPFEQAQSYVLGLPQAEHPVYIITCNFNEFRIYDTNLPKQPPQKVVLADLGKEWHRLSFLIDTENAHIKKEVQLSAAAGEIISKLYDALLERYPKSVSDQAEDWLNKLCVRLVFCMYAEHSGIFPQRHMFQDYLRKYDAEEIHEQLAKIFTILNTKEEERKSNTRQSLMRFPYVNGGLFEDEADAFAEQIPIFSEECKRILLDEACEFDWSDISPTIFGAMFESTLNKETRKHGGMHYTSIENIHKVIDPLFLDGLKAKLEHIKSLVRIPTKIEQVIAFRKQLASLKFLDPACGSGNFLTLTYLELRKLDTEALFMLQDEGQYALYADEEFNPIMVSIENFYGIEINDFAVKVARTALWIAEHQMWIETKKKFSRVKEIIPLTKLPQIKCANALRIDWNKIVQKEHLSYIISNPPFLGARIMKEGSPQKQDVAYVFDGICNSYGDLDYVSCWFQIATEFMRGTTIKTALVATNSVCQGVHVPLLWENLFNQGIHINFAYRTFIWDNEATKKASVHCVIVGFSYTESGKNSVIFDDGKRISVKSQINAYLRDAPLVFVKPSKTRLSNSPEILTGSMPNDDKGKLSKYTTEQKDAIISKYPQAAPLFRRFIGAHDFLHGDYRWCLWLVGVSKKVVNSIPPIQDAVHKVRIAREKSTRPATRKLAETPSLFGEIRQPNNDYLIIPSSTSENYPYLLVDFVPSSIIVGNHATFIENPSLFVFGVLSSSVHMVWTNTICGRIKSDTRYSIEIVYNNFPWCTPSPSQLSAIEKTAQGIRDARARELLEHPEYALADMYDSDFMSPDLRKAHRANDIAVLKAYGLSAKSTEEQIAAKLMEMYAKLTANE